MKLEGTVDPSIVVVERRPGYVRYRGEQGEWEVLGVCSCCGQCEVGADRDGVRFVGPVGQPGAVVDERFGQRLDIPVLPHGIAAWPACTLTGRWC